MEKIIIYKKINNINYFIGEVSKLLDFFECEETSERGDLETLYALVQGVEIKLFDSESIKYYFSR